MLFDLPDELLNMILMRLSLEDQLAIASTQKRLFRQPAVHVLQAEVGIVCFQRTMQRYPFSQMSYVAKKLAVTERHRARETLLARFDARYKNKTDGTMNNIRSWLSLDVDNAERLLSQIKSPHCVVVLEDELCGNVG